MHIQEQDLFHGAVLTQLVEFADSITIKKNKNEFGHYIINGSINIIVKYRSSRRSPWRFGFSENEIKIMQQMFADEEVLYLVLVCGSRTICVLNKDELNSVINVFSSDSWITVESRYGSSMWVRGSGGRLDCSIRHNDFPKKLFEFAEEG